MFVKRVLATALFVFFASFGLKAVAVDHVPHVMSLLAVVQPGNYQSSVAVALRSEIMKLDVNQLQHVIATEPTAVFHSPYGFSLIHGWMLNQLADKRLPFYVNQHFSFDKYIRNLIDVMLAAKVEIYQVWLNARAAIEEKRWEYYRHMQYIPAAIAQAGVPGGIAADVIKPAYVQALDPAGFNAHAESIVGADLKPSDMKTRFESVMLWQLKNFDLNLLLPINYEINEPRKFVEYVSLKCPGVDTGRVFHVADQAAGKATDAIKEGHSVLLTSLLTLAVHQVGHAGGIPTAKNELGLYAVEQPKGDPTAGVPCLVAAVGA
ncbi:MAG: hypothetical protein WCJ92_05850 [Alphaproteobacteria bacterium]